MKPGFIILLLCELAAFYCIWNLWHRKHKSSLTLRIFWSFVLLLPVLGVLLYTFVLNDPAEKPGWTDEDNQGWGDYPSENHRHPH